MVKVSIIIPVHNGQEWVDECMQSILQQDFTGSMEVSVHNDCSDDRTLDKLRRWELAFRSNNIAYIYGEGRGQPRGVGYAKNRAVQQSSGDFLCFQDVDDVMFETRISEQLKSAERHQNCIVGARFVRDPLDSTARFTRWANNLPQEKLVSQIYSSHGPTIIMPTWFCARKVFDYVGGFSEDGHGIPEDLIFFYKHLDAEGGVIRVDKKLITYRYHPSATTFSIHKDTIFNIRLNRLQTNVLCHWVSFVIWNAGKQGRRFYRSLSKECRSKVSCFCDVDLKKLAKGVYIYEESDDVPKPRIPIKHFRNVTPPFVICMKLDLTDGLFEENLKSLNLSEGTDYVLFT